MANFTPSGKVRIGRVPFDNSYRHTMTFDTLAEQTTFFSSCCTQAFEKDTYTYIRMNNSIRVQFNAESLYTYDYVMYQNSNYGDKWFYAFIVGVNYINENTTELVLELDVMQTWYFDYTLVQGFVEREHVNDDTIGAHINPEPNMDLEYIYEDFTPVSYEQGNYYIVLLVSSEPHEIAVGGGQTSYSGTDPVSGNLYQNMFNACKALIFPAWKPNAVTLFKQKVEAYNESGSAEAIVDAYCAPATSFDPDYLQDIGPVAPGSGGTGLMYTLLPNCPPSTFENNIERPLSLNGYVPKNNKLLCFPYCYLELGDFTGRTEQLRWEFFTLTNTGRAVLESSLCGISDCQGYITPKNYNNAGDGKNYKPFTFDFTNKISWIYSAYQNWVAQNSIVNQLAILGSAGTMLAGAGMGLDAASRVLGQGIQSANNLSNLSGINSPAGQALMARNSSYYSRQAADAFLNNANGGMVAGGAGGMLATAANIERMHRVPNTAKGNTAGNSRFQNGYCGWYRAKVCLRVEFARIVDDFLSMYGYQIDRVKIPNRVGRRYWNYVKMQNSCHRGNVPSDQMAKINHIYDTGITFWHTSDVGNYALINSIVE